MKKKLLTIIFGVLFFNPQFITAQNTSKISGYIIDSNSKNPLIGVNISITKSKGATTNTNGYFELTNLKEGKYILKVSMVGYKSIIKKLTIKNGETKKINFKLIESIQALDDVTITAKSKAREIRENALPVSVISIKDIQGTVSNVGEILTKTAGIKIRSFGGVGSESRISVRGLEGKRIGFFIDGTPLSDQSDFIGVNDIPTDLIDRIEVYKGIVPAKFGGSAIGGAVNIVTKELPPTYVDFNYSMQSYNTHNANIIYKKNNKEKGYEFGGGILYTYSDNNYTMESPFNPDLKIKRDHDEFEKKFIGVNFKAKKWWFDVVVFEPFLIQSRKEIQGITQNIQEAVSTADAYGLTNQMQKKDFLTEGLDLDFGVGYGYSIFKFQDKAMQRYNWDGTTYAPVTTFGGEIGSTPNDAVIKKHTLMQKTNLNYILNDNSTINLNTVYTYAHGNPKD
ncbi:MAG TPA: TonB-dependent receptor, partial [Flavobacteriaceae bacterium]|nr:TonB-dependent receptor [Flavobacteriaceae bacterium]